MSFFDAHTAAALNSTRGSTRFMSECTVGTPNHPPQSLGSPAHFLVKEVSEHFKAHPPVPITTQPLVRYAAQLSGKHSAVGFVMLRGLNAVASTLCLLRS
ncbi:hypothetical protein GJ744_006063 [Endocarpon pusillum]|uniref:Uncharacterized protein n=1 Tax=Endocarpon pusillum TaxID=364733 RepID=A0A8H7APM5_9EURO|nr:hypothetical protein GJ744_006063 [Endocarpon pusillum]